MAQERKRRRAPRSQRLDQERRKIIIHVLARGCSREAAAGFVGCASSTIRRAAKRDADFARQLAHAENAARIAYASRINAAAAEPRFWRAAAWWLERRDPDDFSRLPPNTITVQQASKMFVDLLEYIGLDPGDEKTELALKRMRDLVKELQETGDAPADPTPPPSNAPDEVHRLEGSAGKPGE